MDDTTFEMLCKKVHDAWAAEKVRQGFENYVFNPTLDLKIFGGEGSDCCVCGHTAGSHHADMLPYADLAEHVKEYDRATVRAVLAAIKSAGLQIGALTNDQSPRR